MDRVWGFVWPVAGFRLLLGFKSLVNRDNMWRSQSLLVGCGTCVWHYRMLVTGGWEVMLLLLLRAVHVGERTT
jgi:hypothetical protein